MEGGKKMTMQLTCQNLCNNLKDRIDFLKDIELANKIEQLHRDMSEAHKELFIVRQRIMQRHYFDCEQFFKIEGYMRIKLRDYPNNRKKLIGDKND